MHCAGAARARRCPEEEDRIVHVDEGLGPDDLDDGSRSGKSEVVVVRARRSSDASLAQSLGKKAMRLAIRATSAGMSTGRSLVRSAAESAPGQVVLDFASGALDALGRESGIDWDGAERTVEQQLGRVVAVVAPVVVQSIDPEELLRAIDVNAFVDAVDLNAVLDQVDVDALLARVDVDGLLERVDVNALLARVDVEAMLARVEVDDLVGRVDVDALLARADVDGVVSRVDVHAVARRARIGELVAESSSDVAGSALDLGRRQAVALDILLARSINRVLGRDSSTMPNGPPTLIEGEDIGS